MCCNWHVQDRGERFFSHIALRLLSIIRLLKPSLGRTRISTIGARPEIRPRETAGTGPGESPGCRGAAKTGWLRVRMNIWEQRKCHFMGQRRDADRPSPRLRTALVGGRGTGLRAPTSARNPRAFASFIADSQPCSSQVSAFYHAGISITDAREKPPFRLLLRGEVGGITDAWEPRAEAGAMRGNGREAGANGQWAGITGIDIAERVAASGGIVTSSESSVRRAESVENQPATRPQLRHQRH
jgi:hypothetical protein